MFRNLALALVFVGLLFILGCENGSKGETENGKGSEAMNSAAQTDSDKAVNADDAAEAPMTAEQPGSEQKQPEENRAQRGSGTNENQPRTGGGQSGNQGNRQQGQGGGGGMRMGGGGAGGMLSLAMRDDVRKEIGLTDEQATKLREKLREIMPQPSANGERPNVNPEELAKKAEAAAKSVLTAAQLKRLGELQLQREGATALARKEVADKVGLPEATRAKIETMISQHNDQIRQQFSERPANQEEAQKRAEEMRKGREKLRADILALLTPEQKAKWDALLGKPFEFQQGGGGGGRPGAGGFQRPQVD
jgi:hypothetical protein